MGFCQIEMHVEFKYLTFRRLCDYKNRLSEICIYQRLIIDCNAHFYRRHVHTFFVICHLVMIWYLNT